MADLAITVPPTVVYAAKAQPGKTTDALPSYGTWRATRDIVVLDCLACTSMVGHSYAKLAPATGAPGRQIDVEKVITQLGFGDRVAVGYDWGDYIDWQFCGYVITNQLSIDARAERCVWKVVGPEFWWGDNSPTSGAGLAINGQGRRLSGADDTWQKTPATVTDYAGWEIFTDEPAHFNPGGQANMTRDDVKLTSPKEKKLVNGKLFEIPNRRVASIDAAKKWNMREAAKYLLHVYGDLAFSGIAAPDWSSVPMLPTDIVRDTEIEGLGCFEALRRMLGGKFGFYVDPRPMKEDGKPVRRISGRDWGPFQIHFFKRSEGPAADLQLNRRGTSMRAAKASVTRLEVASDVSKAANRIIVAGSYVQSVKLIYWGGRTPTLPPNLLKTAIQNGWHKGEALLADYATTKPGEWTVSPMFPGVTADHRKEWLLRYHAKGPEFLKYWRIFRHFTWNEANELETSRDVRYRLADMKWYAPDLLNLADPPERPGFWYRRRRKMLDTLYLRNETVSGWERHRPTLFMSAAPAFDSPEWANLKWRRISESHFQFEPDRCALTIIVDDISEWRPFDKQDSLEADESQQWPDDPRSFASLLHEGVLRMCVECSIPVDDNMRKVANPTGTAGAPFPREVLVSAQANYVKSLTYTGDGLTQTPSGLTPAAVDLSDDAQRQADITRDASQDEAIHASITTSGDWDRQALGSQIASIGGTRPVNLSGKTGRGAQIVAVRLDFKTFTYEYLTESLAMAIRAKDKALLEKRAKVYKDAKRPTDVPDFARADWWGGK